MAELEGEEMVKTITISDLLRFSHPVCGASSIRFPAPPPPLKKLKTLPKPQAPNHPVPNPKFFTPFKHPVILIGTIHLPTPSPSHDTSCTDHCFSFSDNNNSTTVCCSLLNLQHDLTFINNHVRILAWNFIPFSDKHHGSGGILEIVRWELFPTLSQVALKDKENCVNVTTLTGVVQLVSPIFLVPYKTGGNSAVGFLAKLVTSNASEFVYFIEHACKWRVVLNMLVGKLVEVSGVKKKMIYVGGGDVSYEMNVTKEKCAVSMCKLPLLGNVSSWRGVEGVYNGVVTGVYMQGMAVELDSKVWLLVTNPRIAPPHSVRVGAVVSVWNSRLMHPKFSWIKMHLLGTCARTSIKVISFSLADVR